MRHDELVVRERVYELAKEIGVDSKELLAWLNSQGEFVRSLSSRWMGP